MKNHDNGTSRWAHWCRAVSICAVGASAVLAGCDRQTDLRNQQFKARQERAIAMWGERCKKAGEFIHRTAGDVEGIFVINVRTSSNFGEQPEDQFALDDPYGSDVTDDDYLKGFLREANGQIGHPAFRFVEAVYRNDGQIYRYTGRMADISEGTQRFILEKELVGRRTVRYGVKSEDISTREEREHWIAGSSLKVIDMDSQEVLGERIGYMVDVAQGSRSGARLPWLLAASNACPSFDGRHASTAQLGQTRRFVQKVLRPAP